MADPQHGHPSPTFADAMNDHLEATHSDSAWSLPSSPADTHADESMTNHATALERRINRLEDAVAHLQDTRSLEERVVERVSERLQRQQQGGPKEVAGVVIESSRTLLPAVSTSPRDNAGKAATSGSRSANSRRPWLLMDMLAEARAIFRMYFDPRYHLSWRARLIPVVLVAVILTSSFWIPGTGIAIVGPLFDKILNLILAFVLYKILSYEARKYRETAPDLPASLRLKP